MNEQELKQCLKLLNDLPLPDKQAVLEKAIHNVEETTAPHHVRRLRVRRIRPLLAAALSIILLISVLSVCAVAAEHIEYRAALAFFEQHKLSADGLGRRDIRLVYRDIQSGDFRYDKTAEVIASTVGGYEITTDELTPEILQSLWNKKLAEDERRAEDARNGFTVEGEITPAGVSYVYRNQSRYVESVKQTQAILECYHDGRLAWSRTYDGVSAMHVSHYGNHIALICQDLCHDEEMQQVILLLDKEGSELWRRPIGDELASVFCTKDGVTVMTSDTTSLSIRRYDLDGDLTHSVRKGFDDMGLVIVEQIVDDDGEDAIRIVHSNYIPKGSVRVGNDYILHLQEQYTKTELIIRVNDRCELLGEYRFKTDGQAYRFSGIATLGDTLYLSGYAVAETNVHAYEEMSELKEQLLGGLDLDDRELTERVRANYTAVLLKCDATTGKTEAFYSVPGAVGDRFSLDADGNLVWRVNEIASATHKISAWSDGAPYISHIKGVGPVWEYTVSPEGILLDSHMTDDVTEFSR